MADSGSDEHAGHTITSIIEAMLGTPVRATRPIDRSTGRSGAVCQIAEMSGGDEVFVKVGHGAPARRSLEFEHRVARSLRAPFMLDSLGFASVDDVHVLIMERAERAAWPPPWTPQQIDAMLQLFADVRSTKPPALLDWAGSPEFLVADQMSWEAVADDPTPFVDIGIASRRWAQEHVDELQSIARRADVNGSALTHCDAKSSNVCILGDGPRLIDWAYARKGHPNLDLHTWVLSLSGDTGMSYPELVADGGVEHLIHILGFFAAAPYAERATRPRTIRPRSSTADDDWSRPLRAALPWVCELAGIEPPDGSAATVVPR